MIIIRETLSGIFDVYTDNSQDRAEGFSVLVKLLSGLVQTINTNYELDNLSVSNIKKQLEKVQDNLAASKEIVDDILDDLKELQEKSPV
jgi:CII-binding regulator of phage lambda lysogenization HflD